MTPTPAGASTAAVVGEELLIGADAGEVNRIVVELGNATILISDSAGIESGAGCKDRGDSVACRARNIQLVVVHSGDRNDLVRVGVVKAFIDAGPGDDVLRDLDGAGDVLKGGSGDDYIDSQDEKNDRIYGGPGEDESGTSCSDRVVNVESGVTGCA